MTTLHHFEIKVMQLTQEVGNEEALGGTPPGESGSKLTLVLTETKIMPNKNHAKLYLANLQSTQQLGKCIGQIIRPDTVLTLSGEIGSGKTTLVKAIAGALGVQETVSSPTFVMMNEYHSGRLPIYHMDFYRLIDQPSEGIPFNLLGSQLEEVLNTKAVIFIEWADVLSNRYQKDLDSLCENGFLNLNLTAEGIDNEVRILTLTHTGENENTAFSLFADLCQLSKNILITNSD